MTDAHQNFSAHSIDDVIHDCQKWLSTALTSFLYKEAGSSPVSELPGMYLEWIDSPVTQSAFRAQHLAQVKQSANELLTQLRITNKIQPPGLAAFKKFMEAFGHFMFVLNEIENGHIAAGNGIDSITGFKVHALLLPEMRRELERTGRHGNPFSVIMLRIGTSVNLEEQEFKLRAMSTALNQCLRGFDDVYSLNDTDLLISLKHSDIKGGLRFVERVKTELKNIHADFLFSSCVAEPDPGSELVKFLKDLENDLTQIATHGGGQTVKFEDVSPLQRYVSTIKEQS